VLSGTLLNVITVSVGSTLGLIVGQKMPDRIHKIIFDGLGLLTLLVGVQMGLETRNVLLLLGAVLIGGIIGELLKIESNLDRFGSWAQHKLTRGNDGRFSEAFVASSLVFCVGPMTITGSLQNGLTGDYRLLALKSFLDLFSSFAFAASLGWGVVSLDTYNFDFSGRIIPRSRSLLGNTKRCTNNQRTHRGRWNTDHRYRYQVTGCKAYTCG